MDGMLSQDEINALLSGMGSGGDDAESTGTATVKRMQLVKYPI